MEEGIKEKDKMKEEDTKKDNMEEETNEMNKMKEEDTKKEKMAEGTKVNAKMEEEGITKEVDGMKIEGMEMKNRMKMVTMTEMYQEDYTEVIQ